MQTRRDQLQAYRFVTRRVMAALLHGEPDAPESPMRKLAIATFSGLMVAVLIVAGFGVWGLLRPGGAKALTEPGTLIIEKETGTVYVYVQAEEMLHPVTNYVSARLILDSENIKRRLVSRKSLAKFDRGSTLGINGAPNALVDNKDLIRDPWVVCSREEPGPGGESSPRPISTLLIGREVGGQPLGADRALVTEAGGQLWVVWRNIRMKAEPKAAKVVPQQVPIRVDTAFLNAMPAGPDFAAPAIAGRGAVAIYQVGGRTPHVGDLFEVRQDGAAARHYVALANGLAPVSETEALIIQQDVEPQEVSAAAVQNAPESNTPVSNDELPSEVPQPVDLPDDEATPLCATYHDTDGESADVVVTQGGDVPLATERREGQNTLGSFNNDIDQVIMAPGGGALVGALPGPGQASQVTTYFVISEQGYGFQLKSADLIGKLGYDAASAVLLPVNLLKLIPKGPMLDPEKASQPVQIVPSQTGGANTAVIPPFGD